jgi:hypothetical protein
MLSGALLGCRTPPLLGGTAVTRPAPAVAPFIRPDIEALTRSMLDRPDAHA